MTSKEVLVVGDIHGDWGYLNALISKKHPDIILQVGDFGWWPHFHNKTGLSSRNKKFNQFGIKNHDTKVFWIPGNHENWDDLNCLSKDEPVEIQDGITYCPFGTVIEINGLKILCCGGAESTDKKWRIEGHTWWRQEVVTQEEMDNLPECDIDIVISHTIPRFFFEYAKWGWLKDRYNDPSTLALQLIFERYKPKRWYSGHFHYYQKQMIDDCDWISLSMCGNGQNWWVKL